MVRDLALGLLAAGLVALGVAVAHWRRRQNRLHAGYKRLEEHADALLQDMQGALLNVQGIVTELPSGDPIRERIENVLARADHRLANFRERVQPLCSKQQQERIQ